MFKGHPREHFIMIYIPYRQQVGNFTALFFNHGGTKDGIFFSVLFLMDLMLTVTLFLALRQE